MLCIFVQTTQNSEHGAESANSTSCQNNGHDESQLSATNTTGSDRRWASMSRLERKRLQEKRRRQEFKESLDNLLATLLGYDNDFKREARQREERMTGRLVAQSNIVGPAAPPLPPTTEGENALFSRVELVNQATFTINQVATENAQLQQAFADLRAGRGASLPPRTSFEQRRAVFHQGVGPLSASSVDVSTASHSSPMPPTPPEPSVSSSKTRTGYSEGAVGRRRADSAASLGSAVSDQRQDVQSSITSMQHEQQVWIRRRLQQEELQRQQAISYQQSPPLTGATPPAAAAPDVQGSFSAQGAAYQGILAQIAASRQLSAAASLPPYLQSSLQNRQRQQQYVMPSSHNSIGLLQPQLGLLGSAGGLGGDPRLGGLAEYLQHQQQQQHSSDEIALLRLHLQNQQAARNGLGDLPAEVLRRYRQLQSRQDGGGSG